MSTRCSSCQAAIVWAVTTKGARMPVDAAPADDGNIVLIDTAGGIQAIVVRPGEFPGQKRHRSHFSTCPNHAQHRKARR
jgi:hypothetical protein